MSYEASSQPYSLGITEVEAVAQKYVTYIQTRSSEYDKRRVSLDAQKRDIAIFLESYLSAPYQVIGEFIDELSYADDDLNELAKAIDFAKKSKATLLIAALDRVPHAIALSKDPDLSLRVAQMPFAERFQLQIYATLLEQERDFRATRIQARVRAAKVRSQETQFMWANAALRAAEEEEARLEELRQAKMKRNATARANARARAQRLTALSNACDEPEFDFRQDDAPLSAQQR